MSKLPSSLSENPPFIPLCKRGKEGYFEFQIRTVVWLILCGFFIAAPLAFAQEIKIVFTGQSYASLYPCACPREPDGGVARRAAFIKNLRAEPHHILVLEAGNSFASGKEDQHAQNESLDRRRTEIYLQALKVIGYDALLAGAQELVFGVDFLKSHKQDLDFIASNTRGFLHPYVVKEAGAVKVGILGLGEDLVSVKIINERIAELKKKDAGVIILLSSRKPQEDKEFLKEVSGIDVVINGSPSFGSVRLIEEGPTAYLTTWWQARKIGVLTLVVEGSKIIKKSLESFRLSSELKDDEAVAGMLPECFGDAGCLSGPGTAAKCLDPGTPKARCVYEVLPQEALTIIIPRDCRLCRSEAAVRNLENIFGNLKISSLYSDDPAAVKMIDEFKMTMLPAYVLDKKIEESAKFSSLEKIVDKSPNFYMLKPAYAGVAYFIRRPRVAGRLDVFFDYSYPHLARLFSLLKAFTAKYPDTDIRINFLAAPDKAGVLVSKGGLAEIEEFRRTACAASLSPRRLFDYAACRAQAPESTWWEKCALDSGLDSLALKECAVGAQGGELVKEKSRLTQELEIVSGPAFLVDNKEIFAIVGVPSLEEFERATGTKE